MTPIPDIGAISDMDRVEFLIREGAAVSVSAGDAPDIYRLVWPHLVWEGEEPYCQAKSYLSGRAAIDAEIASRNMRRFSEQDRERAIAKIDRKWRPSITHREYVESGVQHDVIWMFGTDGDRGDSLIAAMTADLKLTAPELTREALVEALPKIGSLVS